MAGSTTTRSGFAQPAFIGGAVLGTLSALPIVNAGNLCCCLWVVCGGAIAAYVLQQNQPTAITPGDGAWVGLLAGIVGAFVYLALFIPISIVMAPVERAILERVVENASGMPPEFREFLTATRGVGVRAVVGFAQMLVIGSIFSTVGGVLGAALFKKPIPPGTIDVPSHPV